MKMNRIFMLIVLIGKIVKCTLYVDIKKNYISEGIVVHYGKYGSKGKYYMYIGKNEPIERVEHEGKQVYPERDDKRSQELVIEIFKNKICKYAIIHTFYGSIEDHTETNRIFYHYTDEKWKKISLERFMSQIKGEIEISYDISNKIMHPYMSQKIECKGNYKEIYTIENEVNGNKLDGIEAPTYTFGIVYDSSKMIKMEYAKLEVFVSKCNEFTIEYNLFGDSITFYNSLGKLEYQIKNLMNQLVWEAQIKEDTKFKENDQVKAVKIKNKIREKMGEFVPMILDIAENISPELFGIEKVTGKVGSGNYVKYQIKKEYAGKYKIKTIIDTKSQCMEILKLDETCIFTSVEAYTNRFRTILVVNSLVENGSNFNGKKEIFKKVNKKGSYYRRLVGMDKIIVHNSLERNYPIKIDLYLDRPETSLYERKETVDLNGNFLMYHIKEADGRGMKYIYKYVFGDILDVKQNQAGNIPEEDFMKKYYKVRKNVNNTDIILVKSTSNAKLQRSDYKSYNIIRL